MKEIKNYENYLIDENGKIYSKKTKKILKSCVRKDGYMMVGLYKNGYRKNFQIHSLVAETFIPNPNDLPQVNHKDEDKTNNNISNLEWCTAQYNLTYGNRISKSIVKRKERDPRGESYKKSMETRRKSNPNNECFRKTVNTRTIKGCVNAEKRIGQYDQENKLVREFKSIAQAAKETNCSAGCICECAKGKKKQHKGFLWKYIN